MLSKESVMFLTSLLDAVQLSGNDPHLVDTANAMARARKELDSVAFDSDQDETPVLTHPSESYNSDTTPYPAA